MKNNNIKIALQTKIPLKVGNQVPEIHGLENVINFLEEASKRNLISYIIESSSIFLGNNFTPSADAYVLVPTENRSENYKSLFVREKKIIDLNNLDGLLIRGDDIQENPNLDTIFPYIDQEKVSVPIDYFESKKTKDKLDLINEFKDFKMPKTLYAEDSLDDLNKSINYFFDKGDNFVVLKYRWGHGGKQVIRLDKNDSESSKKALNFMNKYKQIIVQEYDPSVKQGDIRVVVYNTEPIIAYDRKSKNGDWKNSISRGSSWSVYDLSNEQKNYCRDLASKFPKTKYLGLDLFKNMNIIEVNAFCGGTNKTKLLTGKNILGDMFDEVQAFKYKNKRKKYNWQHV